MATQQETLEKLVGMIKDIDVALFTTVGEGGYLVSRPLSTKTTAFDGSIIWFFTEADTAKVSELKRNSKVNVAYSSHKKNSYVSFAGDARLNRDRELIHTFWNDALKAFFPKGKDDPNLALIEFMPRTAQYWDGPASLIGKAATFLMARVTGNDDYMGENKVVDMQTGRARKPPGADGVTGKRKAAAKKAASKPLTRAAGTTPSGSTQTNTVKSPTKVAMKKGAAKTAASSAPKSLAKKGTPAKPAGKRVAENTGRRPSKP